VFHAKAYMLSIDDQYVSKNSTNIGNIKISEQKLYNIRVVGSASIHDNEATKWKQSVKD
jgi:hypothetical protein